MSTATVPPTIPPRPNRAQQAANHGVDKLPEIPPRPIPKRLDRSVSPANYPGSPLNEPHNLNLSRTKSKDPTDLVPRRPSVQNLPSIGQEGLEYSDIQYQPGEITQTRRVGEDLHLHAPKPSLPKSSATAQVQAVTKTDSQNDTPDDERQIRPKSSFSRPSSAISGERRASVSYDEQGPAEIGIRVPINPLLGDVQAPSPNPFTPSHTGDKKKHHYRTKSGRDINPPPGSYGLHGHGVIPQDKFEKDWYSKHPEQLQHEEGHGHGVYESIGSGRGVFALSSDDLNKIVRKTKGTNNLSYPDEQIGYMASDQYTKSQNDVSDISKMLTKTLTNTSQPAVESPLKRSSFSADEVENDVKVEPSNHYNKITGGEETMNESDTPEGLIDEHGYTVPILASDEVEKNMSEHMHPAVSPRHSRRGSQYEIEYRSGDATPNSRPSSRPGSIYGMHSASHSLARFISHHDDRDTMHTPLEDVDEYEPLFPDEDSKQKALSHAERFKRPEALRNRFPSQDIWEDTPSSVMYEATVSTPELQKLVESKNEVKDVKPEEKLTKSRFGSHLVEEMSRPKLAQRFPSQDIWEDTPDSSQLVTTIGGEELEISKPTIPPRPKEKTSPELRKVPSIPDRPKPQIPTRPAKKLSTEGLSKTLSTESTGSNETEKQISPTKVKPQIPARPNQNKLVNLKGNFMNDLNQKLGLGPPKEKEKEKTETEEEVKTLEDARKGRAKGPQRRAPAKSPAKSTNFTISQPKALWHIDSNNNLNVLKSEQESSDKLDPPVMSEEKITQMDNSTPGETKPPTINTKDSAEIPTISTPANPTGDLATPATEKSNPLSHQPSNEDDLSKQTTATSTSGKTLEREDPDPNTDAIPASRQTTAESKSGQPLEKVKSEESVEYHDEQVKAPAPDDQSITNPAATQIKPDTTSKDDQPTEPMNEDDVSYKKLEELSAQADGKEKSDSA